MQVWLRLLLLAAVCSGAQAAGPGAPGGPGNAMIDTDPCPSGWRLSGRISPQGAFSCRPQSRTSGFIPAEALACPAGTHYFIDAQRLGCRRLPASSAKRPSYYGTPVKKGST